MHASGTEPVLRIYAKARDTTQVDALLQAGATLAGTTDEGTQR